MPRLKDRYRDEVVSSLMKEFNYTNPMQVPRVEKAVINMGVGQGQSDSKILDAAVRDMTMIAGQKPVVTRATRSIAAFRLRAGNKVGCKVTLRGDRMWYFLDKLINAAMPRIRDFQGLNPNSFDGHGNFAVGLKEQLIFPEIEYDQVDKIRGMDIIITTTANSDDEGRALLKALGLKFRVDK